MSVVSVGEYSEIMKKAGQLIPKETKKFLKTETQKLKRHLLREANNSVTPSKIEENIDDENRPRHLKYHKSFKAGKTYKYNQALSKRVFNASRHGWFIESGRPVARGYKKRDGYRNMPTIRRSKHYKVYGKVIPPFEKIWSDDTEQWVDKMMKEGKL